MKITSVILLLVCLSSQQLLCGYPQENPANAMIYTNHYYPETIYAGISEYEIEATVRGESISSVTVEGPQITVISLEYSESTSGEWKWTRHIGLSAAPQVGDTYQFTVTYNDESTESLTAAVTEVMEEFPQIIFPLHQQVITTYTPTFQWSEMSAPLSQFYLRVTNMSSGRLVWSQNLPVNATSVDYNSDGLGAPLYSDSLYMWMLWYESTDYGCHGIIFSEFYIDAAVGFSSTEMPLSFKLYQNYPNPFNPVTTINFELPHDGRVELAVYDALGRKTSILVDGYRNAGRYEVNFDATGTSSGVYFYRLESNGMLVSKKFVVIK